MGVAERSKEKDMHLDCDWEMAVCDRVSGISHAFPSLISCHSNYFIQIHVNKIHVLPPSLNTFPNITEAVESTAR